MATVTDPNLIAQLDAHAAQTNGTPVTDPELAAQLDALSPTTSALGAAGRGALDALPFGAKAAAGVESALDSAHSKTYKDYLAELDTLTGADKEQHPIAHYAGEAAGTVAPLAIPGVGEALTADSLAARAGTGAAIGALQGASNNRNPESLLGDVAKGAGVGAVAQPLVGALGDVVSGAGDAIANSKLGSRASSTLFAQTNGLNPMALRKLAAIGHEDPEAAVNAVAEKLRQIVPPEYYSPTSSINQKYSILHDIQQKAGQVIGSARDVASTQDFPEGAEAIKELMDKAENWQDIANPEGADNLKNAAAMLQAAQNKGALNFDNMQAIKSKVGEGFSNPNNIKPGTAEIYGTLNDKLDSALDRMAPTNPNIDPKAFADAKAKYALTSKIMPLMLRGAGREVNSALSPTKALMGLASMGVGHPAGAAVAGLKAGQELGAPELGANLGMMAVNALKNGAHIPSLPAGAAAANAAGNAATMPNLDHPAMAPFKPQFQAALKGVSDPAMREKTIATTDYVMQQNNPAYAKAKQEAASAAQ